MIYNVTDNRISIDCYFFEMDTQHNLYIYIRDNGLKYLDMVKIGSELDYDDFEKFCQKWLIENEKGK